MSKLLLFTTFLAIASMTPGCAYYNSPVKPPRGFIYTETCAPLVIPEKKTSTDQPLHSRKSALHVQDWIFTGASIGAGEVALEKLPTRAILSILHMQIMNSKPTWDLSQPTQLMSTDTNY